jgi:anti-sigma regulatory factor (Ser/Thr protein kinase)
VSTLPLKIINELNAKYLKRHEPITTLVSVISNQLSLFHHHSAIFTVLSELYNNALDHGLLMLDSTLKKSDEGFFDYFTQRQERLDALKHGSIVLTTEYNPQTRCLCFQFKDSGKGFDLGILNTLNAIDENYGRGIALVKELCDSVTYSDGGSTVDVVYKI